MNVDDRELSEYYNDVLCSFYTLVLVDIDDYYDVYDKVKPLSARWKPIAISLRLRINTIDTIETNYRGDALSCLQKVLGCWLRKDYNYNKYGVPCWRMVCVAVNEGGDPALADQIARENPLPATRGTSPHETPNEQPLPTSEKTNKQAMSPATLAGKFVLILNIHKVS